VQNTSIYCCVTIRSSTAVKILFWCTCWKLNLNVILAWSHVQKAAQECEASVWSAYKANTLHSSRQPSNLITTSTELLSRVKNKPKTNIKRTCRRPLCFVLPENVDTALQALHMATVRDSMCPEEQAVPTAGCDWQPDTFIVKCEAFTVTRNESTSQTKCYAKPSGLAQR